MRRRLRVLVLTATAFLVPIVGLLGSAPAVSAAEPAATVVGDDVRDVYVGTGGLLLPRSVDEPMRQRVAGCLGCGWRLSQPCAISQDGHAFDGSQPCESVARGCPQSRRTFRTWFADEPGRWQDVGIVCMGEPVTVRAIQGRVRDQMIERLPSLSLDFQPGRGVVTQIPVVFATNQAPGRVEFQADLGDTPVHVAAVAEWEWDFGDTSHMTTDQPGCPYPCLEVGHTYRRPGTFVIRVRSTWEGRFTADGLGPFPISGPVHQDAAALIAVGEGRALLVPAGYGTMAG
mgnify:CR=1 FL=1